MPRGGTVIQSSRLSRRDTISRGDLASSSGFTDTLDDAKREFAAAWRAWLAKTGKDEETHRPFYGRPVPLNRDALFLACWRGVEPNPAQGNADRTRGGGVHKHGRTDHIDGGRRNQ